MPIRRIVMMVMAGCMVGMLTGCGVPQEEFDAKVAELDAAAETNNMLTAKVEDLGTQLNAEKSNVRSMQLKLDDANKSLSEMEAKDVASAQALATEQGKVADLESALSTLKSAKQLADDQISELEAALAELQAEYENLQHRFGQLKKNMLSFGEGGSSPAVQPQASSAPQTSGKAPAADSKSALDLLDEMGMQ